MPRRHNPPRDHKRVAEVMSTPRPGLSNAASFVPTAATAAECRVEAARYAEMLANRDRSDCDLARLKAILGLPDSAAGADVVAEVWRLKIGRMMP